MKNKLSALKIIFIIWFVGIYNAVNLLDGLDGLAILPSVLIAGALGLIAYGMGNQIIADYLYLPHLELSGELIVFCGALIGSGIGFLWYNTYPAQIFMGDVGSLTLGAILGIMAVILRHELVFAIMAGVFVLETLSVAIQKDQSINELFKHLSEQSIQVNSLRNESNRLEEMFIEMVKKSS